MHRLKTLLLLALIGATTYLPLPAVGQDSDPSNVSPVVLRTTLMRGIPDVSRIPPGLTMAEPTIEQFEHLEYYKAEIRDLQISISNSGEIAWYSHLLDARIKAEGEEQKLEGARFTGVFEKRNGRWKMVQTHVSLPDSMHS